MKNSRLIQILSSFSSKEKRLCKAWINCSMINQREDVDALYDFLWSMKFKEQYLNKTLAWATIYPKTTYNDGKMRQIMHRLLLAVEDFLVFNYIKNNKEQHNFILINALKQRTLALSLDKAIQQLKIAVQQQPIQNWESLRFAYELESFSFDNADTNQRTTPLNLQELSDSLDIQYFADKLRKACLLYSRLVVFKMDYSPKMLEVVLNQVQELNYLEIPAIGIYYYCYQSLIHTDQSDAYFQKMMAYLDQYAAIFPPQEIRELYLLAINYTIKKLNAGSQDHLQKAYELYKTGITNGYLLEDGIITTFTYNNMVSIGIQMQHYEWVETFIHEYKTAINIEHQESIFKECLAKLYYAKKQYKEAQQLLIQIQVKDILRILSCKIMLAKIYYETQEFNALEALLESLKMYLRRKEVVGYHKENYSNNIRYMQKLIRLNPFDKAAKSKLKTALETTAPLTLKSWFLEQLEAL